MRSSIGNFRLFAGLMDFLAEALRLTCGTESSTVSLLTKWRPSVSRSLYGHEPHLIIHRLLFPIVIQNAYNANDTSLFYNLKGQVDQASGTANLSSHSSPSLPPLDYRTPTSMPSYSSYQPPSYGNKPTLSAQSQDPSGSGLQFKPSPFYRIQTILGNVHTCSGTSAIGVSPSPLLFPCRPVS